VDDDSAVFAMMIQGLERKRFEVVAVRGSYAGIQGAQLRKDAG
jgi:hypothetical protein